MIHERSHEDEAKGKRSLSQEAEEEKQETAEHQQAREGTGRNPKQERKATPGTQGKSNPTKAAEAIFENSNTRVLMLNQKLMGDGLKFLIGKASSCI